MYFKWQIFWPSYTLSTYNCNTNTSQQKNIVFCLTPKMDVLCPELRFKYSSNLPISMYQKHGWQYTVKFILDKNQWPVFLRDSTYADSSIGEMDPSSSKYLCLRLSRSSFSKSSPTFICFRDSLRWYSYFSFSMWLKNPLATACY